MINFILILLGSLAGCYLIATAIQAALIWFSHNPAFWIGCLIGVIISVIGFIKLRKRDKDYYEETRYLPQVAKNHTPKTTQHIEQLQEQSDSADLHSALIRLGYSRIEITEAIKVISKEKPRASLEEKIVEACTFLSDDKAA